MVDRLTPRQKEALHLRCREGLTGPEIAARMFVEPVTAQGHLRHAYRRLGLEPKAGPGVGSAVACYALGRHEATNGKEEPS